MFGSRLKTWMENYIGRPRKKEVQKEKTKGSDRGGVILESSESLAQSDTGISSSSQQVLSSSTTDNREGYSTTTMESEKSGMTHCHTAISLPSPESAYSTGYSTDGASPGGTGPPEYYINIRTGKHYFPSPAPTPTSPQPNTAFLQLNQRFSNSFLQENTLLPSTPAFLPRTSEIQRDRTLARFSNGCPSHLDSFAKEIRSSPRNTLSASVPSHFEIFNFAKSPCKKTPIKLFLKSPKQEKSKVDLNKSPTLHKKKSVAAGKSRKWFKQPFQKFGQRRTDSCDETVPRNEPKREIHVEKNFRYLLGQENSASPRQRNRIRTNPWLPTEPLSSQNFHNLNFSPSLMRNRSCSNTPLQNRKSIQTDSRTKQLNEKYEESKDHVTLEKGPVRLASGKHPVELSDHSEEDLTLNEMMGTYNESYVYEKETDILSDSDPTDCEDYGTDSEAENGGDERDSHDDELDFIDHGSLSESDDNFPQNTGRCTYHDVHVKKNSFLFKNDRRHSRKDSDCRRNSRKEQGRREKRRQVRKSFKQEDEEKKKTFGEKPKVEIDENVGGLNLSRVLVQRMMAKNISKSAEGTPVTARRLRETYIGKTDGGEKKSGTPGNFVLIDLEADNKYNELIKEAENMFEILRNSPVIKNRKEIPRGSQDAGKKTKTAPCETTPETPARKSPKDLGLKLSVETPKKLKRLDFGTSEQTSFRTRSSAHSPLDPLGPNLRNFAVFKPCAERKVSTSSSEDSEPFGEKGREKRWGGVPESPIVPIAFQSVDLGKGLASYCPQSEPVKRKIYSCSKTYDKLVKRFENKPTIFEETKNEKPGPETGSRGTGACLDGNQGLLQRERRKGVLRLAQFAERLPEKPKRLSFDADIFRKTEKGVKELMNQPVGIKSKSVED